MPADKGHPRASASRPTEPRSAPLLLIFFLSGASALIYEVVWTRLLALTFGVTVYAVATVVAAFMAGLALGSLAFGRLADRPQRHLRTYAMLELAIGLLGLLMPHLLDVATRLSLSWQRGAAGSPAQFALATFCLSFTLLLLPATLMGGTLPVLSKYLARRQETIGRRVGLLYAMNTFGGVAGSFASAFLLIAVVGVTATTRVAAAVNVLLALASLLLDRRESAPVPPREDAAPGAPAASLFRAPGARLVMLAYALAGATALAYQVLLTRLAIFFLWDTTVYSFATILTTYLAGLALGSWLLARPVDRWRPLLGIFGALEVGVGVTCLWLVPLVGGLSRLRSWLWETLYTSGELGTWRYLGVKFLMAFAIVLVPTVLMGGTFPVVNRIISRDLRQLGRSVGAVYASNTFGAIVGSIAAGFWLVPALGIAHGILAVSTVNVLLGMLLIARERAWAGGRRAAALAAVAVPFLAAAVFSLPERPVVRYSDLMARAERKVLYEREGREATLAVLEDPVSGVKELNINGQSTAFTTYMDLQVHRCLGHLPALCHPHPRSALVIGFGFGSTCHSILTHGVETLDCVELVRAERETAPLFREVNEDVLADPRLHFIEGDGRNHVLVSDRRYDLLSFNAIHPKLSANLYTLDFYRLCRDRLTDDGVIAAWLPINFLSRDEFKMLVRTFQHVFPHTSFWYVGPGHAVLVGTPAPLVLDYASLRERLALPAVREDLSHSNLDDPCEIVAMCALDEDAVRRFAGEGPLNTDDRPHVEYGISFSSRDWYRNLQDIFALTPEKAPEELVLDGVEGEERDRVERTFRARRYAMFGGMVQTVGLSMRNLDMIEKGIASYRRALAIMPESRNLQRLLRDKEGDFRALQAMQAPGGPER